MARTYRKYTTNLTVQLFEIITATWKTLQNIGRHLTVHSLHLVPEFSSGRWSRYPSATHSLWTMDMRLYLPDLLFLISYHLELWCQIKITCPNELKCLVHSFIPPRSVFLPLLWMHRKKESTKKEIWTQNSNILRNYEWLSYPNLVTILYSESMLSWPTYVGKGCLNLLLGATFPHWPLLSFCSDRTELNHICWKNEGRATVRRWRAAASLLALTGTYFSLLHLLP